MEEGEKGRRKQNRHDERVRENRKESNKIWQQYKKNKGFNSGAKRSFLKFIVCYRQYSSDPATNSVGIIAIF